MNQSPTQRASMAAWAWVLVGTATAIGLALVVGLALARILGRIAAAASRLRDDACRASAPLTRAMATTVGDQRPRHGRRQTFGSQTLR